MWRGGRGAQVGGWILLFALAACGCPGVWLRSPLACGTQTALLGLIYFLGVIDSNHTKMKDENEAV
jgi:hypothetical protein